MSGSVNNWGNAFADLGSGVISSAGQAYTNQKYIQQMQRNNDLSVNLANTAHQREVLDLIAAGLNPILSAGGNGASTPQLGTAEVANPSEGIAKGISSANKYLTSQYELQNDSLDISNQQGLQNISRFSQMTPAVVQSAKAQAVVDKERAARASEIIDAEIEGKRYSGAIGGAIKSVTNAGKDMGTYLGKAYEAIKSSVTSAKSNKDDDDLQREYDDKEFYPAIENGEVAQDLGTWIANGKKDRRKRK